MRALVEIHADGGGPVGFGHVGRCLALADELGTQAVFRVEDESVVAFLREHGARTAGGEEAPLVLLDRRQPVQVDTILELQAAGRRVALMDDLGPGRAVADLVIDPPTAAAWPPAGGHRLAGFAHVLVRGEIRAQRTWAVPAGGPVLLGMGGSDPAGLTQPLAAALDAAGVHLRVALGPGYRGPRPSAGAVLRSAADWAPALREAPLLVTAYGHSMIEAAHLGVAAVAVVFLPEHLEHARVFAQQGTAVIVDMTDGVRAPELVRVVTDLLADDAARDALAHRGEQLVDGLGAARVAAALTALATEARTA